MKKVITRQKYQCGFCQKRSVKHIIVLHEKRCFRNPNRFCDNCKNKGYTEEHYGDDPYNKKIPCRYCEKFDPKQLKEIEERERQEKNLNNFPDPY